MFSLTFSDPVFRAVLMLGALLVVCVYGWLVRRRTEEVEELDPHDPATEWEVPPRQTFDA